MSYNSVLLGLCPLLFVLCDFQERHNISQKCNMNGAFQFRPSVVFSELSDFGLFCSSAIPSVVVSLISHFVKNWFILFSLVCAHSVLPSLFLTFCFLFVFARRSLFVSHQKIWTRWTGPKNVHQANFKGFLICVFTIFSVLETMTYVSNCDPSPSVRKLLILSTFLKRL